MIASSLVNYNEVKRRDLIFFDSKENIVIPTGVIHKCIVLDCNTPAYNKIKKIHYLYDYEVVQMVP